MMEKADRTHGRTAGASLQWGLTEVNVTYRNPDRDVDGFGNTSFLGGQFLAEVFGIGMELGAFTVAPWCISETDRVETDFGYLGLPPGFDPRSSWHHMQMMSRHMVGRFLTSSTGDDEVKSVVTRSERTLAIMILNESLRDLDYAVVLRRDRTASKPLVVTVDAGLAATPEGHIAAQTTVMLVLDAAGEPLLQYTYGLEEAQGHLPPRVRQY
jgi:hypothetical protein